jgi:hypothetical protein
MFALCVTCSTKVVFRVREDLKPKPDAAGIDSSKQATNRVDRNEQGHVKTAHQTEPHTDITTLLLAQGTAAAADRT